jgi:2-polyprenyl-3-methyl-5-hydroxy-6-metoxy-1,4-benzoquinol methylase
MGDVRELPFGDGMFDLVVCFETIEHVADPERLLAELRRVMAGDGLLFVSTPNKREYLVENELHKREFSTRSL